MSPGVTPAFALPPHLAAKADPTLIAEDERHLDAIAEALAQDVARTQRRLDDARRDPGGHGTAALERDQLIHHLSARLRLLRRHGRDLCLGRISYEPLPDGVGAEPLYIGRIGLTDDDGRRLLVDWRSPAAEPYFAATPAHPMGVAIRRRYRWSRGAIRDYWDEVLSPAALARSAGQGGRAALDDQSAFIASLGSSREPTMRDVLGTIQADQDAIIRAGSRGTLVVDGGPGTGKTVVALHRAAYLLYADPHLRARRGRVLFIGPHQPYLAYVADVLPSLGEDGVLTATLGDLLPEGVTARAEPDDDVARLKQDARLVHAVEAAVALYEEPPTHILVVETPYCDLRIDAADWAAAFDAPEPGTPHNDGRDIVWRALADTLVEQARAIDEDIPEGPLRRALARDEALVDAFGGAWPRLDPVELVGDLWSVPAYLRHCAPWLTADQMRMLRRADPYAWTTSDLPILDAARLRLGDPDGATERRRREAAAATAAEEMSRVVEHLRASDDSELQVMSMLGGDDLQQALVDRDVLEQVAPDVLAGPFAHIVVDEAQELTDAEWQMLLTRCPSRSFTVVGDRAQARRPFRESWQERLARVGLDRVDVRALTVNYRTPAEVMAEAAPVIRAVLPDANVPRSVRTSGVPVAHRPLADLVPVLEEWSSRHPEGTACVIGQPGLASTERVRSLTPELVKGLEFDLVVLVRPERWEPVDAYVAMTRATAQLVVLT